MEMLKFVLSQHCPRLKRFSQSLKDNSSLSEKKASLPPADIADGREGRFPISAAPVGFAACTAFLVERRFSIAFDNQIRPVFQYVILGSEQWESQAGSFTLSCTKLDSAANSPFLLQSIFQHLYSSDQIILKILLGLSLALQESYSSLKKTKQTRVV